MVRLYLAFATVLAGLSVPAAAQSSDEAILYSSTNYRGSSYRLSGPTRPIDPPFVAKSIRLPEGRSWEFCTGNTFTGCKELTQSDPSMVLNVRSARPVAPVLAVASSPLASGTEASLRGLSSEYFVTPVEGGARVEVQTGTSEAMSTRAIEFCRARGWRSSPYARLQQLEGKYYLADVLCADTGA